MIPVDFKGSCFLPQYNRATPRFPGRALLQPRVSGLIGPIGSALRRAMMPEGARFANPRLVRGMTSQERVDQAPDASVRSPPATG
jgi:hypothetical protein